MVTLHTYTVVLTDRQRTRTVQAENAQGAIRQACGARFFSARHDNDSVRRNGSVICSAYEVTVRTGATRAGCTPISRTWAIVTRILTSL